MPGTALFGELAREKLKAIEAQGRLRSLRTLASASLGGNAACAMDLTHNDYLNFRDDFAFQERARAAARDWPIGAGASRLLGGEHRIYAELESAFSQWNGSEASLYFTSGYAANETLITVLAQFDADFFSDALNHASLIDGMRLARSSSRDSKHIFRHNDLDHLAHQLKTSKKRAKVVVTESLFSMDGDKAPLRELSALCQEFEALLVVDEAHALGVYGQTGSGLTEEFGLDPKSLITINPCGKAMAASGALISGPAWLRTLLINMGRGFIYSTGASPWVASGLRANLDTIAKAGDRRSHLTALSHELREGLTLLGLDYGTSKSHIIPLILGSEARSLKAEHALAERGILARAIRPPTVPEGSCRLRLSLH
ncbi:MAG: 8-amino-7-oxononanoate synthase, partial [Proteobacteria bacterium]